MSADSENFEVDRDFAIQVNLGDKLRSGIQNIESSLKKDHSSTGSQKKESVSFSDPNNNDDIDNTFFYQDFLVHLEEESKPKILSKSTKKVRHIKPKKKGSHKHSFNKKKVKYQSSKTLSKFMIYNDEKSCQNNQKHQQKVTFSEEATQSKMVLKSSNLAKQNSIKKIPKNSVHFTECLENGKSNQLNKKFETINEMVKGSMGNTQVVGEAKGGLRLCRSFAEESTIRNIKSKKSSHKSNVNGTKIYTYNKLELDSAKSKTEVNPPPPCEQTGQQKEVLFVKTQKRRKFFFCCL